MAKPYAEYLLRIAGLMNLDIDSHSALILYHTILTFNDPEKCW